MIHVDMILIHIISFYNVLPYFIHIKCSHFYRHLLKKDTLPVDYIGDNHNEILNLSKVLIALVNLKKKSKTGSNRLSMYTFFVL